eukprot:scaffold74429_cov57-Phaeocystis_antarctica.AAC.4
MTNNQQQQNKVSIQDNRSCHVPASQPGTVRQYRHSTEQYRDRDRQTQRTQYSTEYRARGVRLVPRGPTLLKYRFH